VLQFSLRGLVIFLTVNETSGVDPFLPAMTVGCREDKKTNTAPIKEAGGPTFTGMSTVSSEILAESIF
jgi:hypothetical protein